jgi:hypothetical protein
MRASSPRPPCLTLWFIVPPRFPAISSPVTTEPRRKALPGASEEIPILPAEIGLSPARNRLTRDLARFSRLSVDFGAGSQTLGSRFPARPAPAPATASLAAGPIP